MISVADAVRSVVDRLTAAGVRGTLDDRDVNPPCVYVMAPVVEYRFGRADFTATFTVWLVTGAAGRNIDLENLAELLETAGAALDWVGVRAEPADLLIPHQAAPLPAYRVTWSERIRQTTIERKP